MMKKAAAMLLSACLALQPCAGAVPYVYGAAKDAAQTVTQDSVLEVEAVSTLLFPYTGQVTVQIRNGKGLEEKKELTLDKGGSALAGFEKLPSGKYTVTVRSEKFAPYTQIIEAVRRREAEGVIRQYLEGMAGLGYTREQAAELLKEECL